MKKIFQTFKDFLKKSPSKELHDKCGTFLEQSGGRPLYRGYGWKFGGKAQEVEIRKDRKPRDTAPLIHTLMDDYFNERFGARVRSQGLFAIGDPSKADMYGQLYYVFPVGDFKFIWGEYNGKPIQDTLILSNMIKDKTRISRAAEAPAIVKSILDSVKWHTTNLEAAIESNAEIVILGDSAIIVPVDKKVPYSKLIER